MRTTGPVQQDVCGAVHDHLAWVGEGEQGLTDTALRVFAAAGADERLVLATVDGEAGAVGERYADDLASGRLVVIPALETYAPVLDGGAGACQAQLAAFDGFVDEALASGYSSIRVVADNTPMLAGTAEQAANWLAWEQLTDGWQVQRPVQGNCYFDAVTLDPARLDAALRRHPASVGAAATWRLSYEQDDAGDLRLALGGAVESFDVPAVAEALSTSLEIAGDRPLELTLRDVTFLHHNVPFALAAAGARPPGLRITDVPAAVSRLLTVLPQVPGLDVR